MTNPILNIAAALHCEAKPIIEQYQLKKITHINLPFPIFVNKAKSIYLIVSGVGKIKMAAATTFLFLWTGGKVYTSFLNVGIAGSTQFDIGESVLAHKIVEHSTQRYCYPFTAPLIKANQGLLATHDAPQITYPADGMVDMEGYAFFQAAGCFVTQEQIQVLKMISDNNELTQKELNEDRINKLISDNMDSIEMLVKYLLSLSEQSYLLEQNPCHHAKFLSNWHFTHSQSLQLKELLRRWQIQLHTKDPLQLCQNEKTAAFVLDKIMKELDDHANCLH